MVHNKEKKEEKEIKNNLVDNVDKKHFISNFISDCVNWEKNFWPNPNINFFIDNSSENIEKYWSIFIDYLFKNVDYVFHLAAKNCINDCQNDPVETFDINVTGTANVFEAAKQNNIKKVIYAESSAMYEGCTRFPTSEYDVKPQSFYSLSKSCTSLLADGYQRYSDLKFTALRYFCVYGPRQDYRRSIPPVFSSFIIKLLNNEQPIIYGTGNKRRDFIHVDDINDFHIKCIIS